MKKFLIKYGKLIPLILYPYAYWLWIICEQEMPLIIATLIYNIYVLFISIYYPVSVIRKKIPTCDAAKANLLIKGLQIPAYLLHFLMGIAGVALGPIFGIPLILMAVVIDWLTIMLSGIGCCLDESCRQGIPNSCLHLSLFDGIHRHCNGNMGHCFRLDCSHGKCTFHPTDWHQFHWM